MALDARPASPPSSGRGARRLLTVGAVVVVLAVLVIALSGLGSRWGWWEFRTGFKLLAWGGYAALAGAALTVVGALLARGPGWGRRLALAAALAVLAVGTVAVPWQWRRTARAVPPIHDITTDTENPPAFVALRDRRPGARNPVEYGGPEVAAQQRAGYPDLAPATLRVPPAEAVARAAAVARDLGWEVVAVDTAAGRVEATDRTRWFGFYDDVVVRVTAASEGARVDVRSLSRVGGSDVGTNARRIRTFLARLTSGD
jgi:uncharacterized protein (DUF1499 family)